MKPLSAAKPTVPQEKAPEIAHAARRSKPSKSVTEKPPFQSSWQQPGGSFVVPESQVLILSQDDSEPASVVVIVLADDEDEESEAGRPSTIPGFLLRYTGPSFLRALRRSQRGSLEALFTKCRNEPIHVVVSPSLYAGGSTQGILGRHFSRLQNGALLEDKIIIALMAWVRAEDADICRSSSKRRSHFFRRTSSRVLTCSGIDKPALDRWIRRVPGGSLTAFEDVYAPIHIGGVHWALLVISVKPRAVGPISVIWPPLNPNKGGHRGP
jgi:hypothetical protein